MKKLSLALIVTVLLSTIAFGEDGKSILGYIDSTSFWVDMPVGWYNDQTVSKRFGTPFFLLPEGYSFENAPAVIYASSFRVSSTKEAMEEDISNFHSRDPETDILDAGTITSKSGRKFELKTFQSKKLKSQSNEAVAYLKEKEFILSIVLSAQGVQQYQRAYPTFKTMVESYELAKIKVIQRK